MVTVAATTGGNIAADTVATPPPTMVTALTTGGLAFSSVRSDGAGIVVTHETTPGVTNADPPTLIVGVGMVVTQETTGGVTLTFEPV